MSDKNLPSPNFDSPNSDFLEFSSTPIPGKNFKPKWGKKNRQDNWKRFGQHQEAAEGTAAVGSPNIGGAGPSPRVQQQQHNWGGGGGGPGPIRAHHGGGFNQHQRYPSQVRGSPYNFNQRGRGQSPPPRFNQHNNRGHQSPHQFNHRGPSPQQFKNRGPSPQQYNNNRKSFFHPSMVQNPWEKLESSRKEHKSMSDSMIPQVGDSLCDRNEEMDSTLKLDDMDSTADSSPNLDASLP